MIFGFLQDMGTYESRKLARWEDTWGYISTARVSDGKQPFETAVKHHSYNDGKMVIVAAYDSVEEAQTGHDTWVKLMTGDNLPEMLVDIANAHVAQLLEAARGQLVFPYQGTRRS